MNQEKYDLLNKVKAEVKVDPEFFHQAVIYMNAGLIEAVSEYKRHALQMEKLAFAYGAASTMRHTEKTKKWIDSMIDGVEKESMFFNLGFSEKIKK